MAKGSGSTRGSSPSSNRGSQGGASVSGLVNALSSLLQSQNTAEEQERTARVQAILDKKQNMDVGLPAATVKKLRDFETQNSNQSKEYGMTLDKDGNVHATRQGGKSSISWPVGEIPADGILIHNHPNYAVNSRAYQAIGSPFSKQDIVTAINTNLAEIRAVTPHYTFSLKRPSGGWGIKSSTFSTKYQSSYNRAKQEASDYLDAAQTKSDLEQRLGRVNVVLFHRTLADIAKQYGWTYTRRKND